MSYLRIVRTTELFSAKDSGPFRLKFTQACLNKWAGPARLPGLSGEGVADRSLAAIKSKLFLPLTVLRAVTFPIRFVLSTPARIAATQIQHAARIVRCRNLPVSSSQYSPESFHGIDGYPFPYFTVPSGHWNADCQQFYLTDNPAIRQSFQSPETRVQAKALTSVTIKY